MTAVQTQSSTTTIANDEILSASNPQAQQDNANLTPQERFRLLRQGKTYPRIKEGKYTCTIREFIEVPFKNAQQQNDMLIRLVMVFPDGRVENTALSAVGYNIFIKAVMEQLGITEADNNADLEGLALSNPLNVWVRYQRGSGNNSNQVFTNYFFYDPEQLLPGETTPSASTNVDNLKV